MDSIVVCASGAGSAHRVCPPCAEDEKALIVAHAPVVRGIEHAGMSARRSADGFGHRCSLLVGAVAMLHSRRLASAGVFASQVQRSRLCVARRADPLVRDAGAVAVEREHHNVVRLGDVSDVSRRRSGRSTCSRSRSPPARCAGRSALELQPQWAALLMSVSSIVVATNAVLLKRAEHTLPAAAR